MLLPGNELILSAESSSDVVGKKSVVVAGVAIGGIQGLARTFTHLNARWSEVTDRIFNRHRAYKEASHQYGEFRGI